MPTIDELNKKLGQQALLAASRGERLQVEEPDPGPDRHGSKLEGPTPQVERAVRNLGGVASDVAKMAVQVLGRAEAPGPGGMPASAFRRAAAELSPDPEAARAAAQKNEGSIDQAINSASGSIPDPRDDNSPANSAADRINDLMVPALAIEGGLAAGIVGRGASAVRTAAGPGGASARAAAETLQSEVNRRAAGEFLKAERLLELTQQEVSDYRELLNLQVRVL